MVHINYVVALDNTPDDVYNRRHIMTNKPLHRYLFKASWSGTAHSFWIEAPNDLVARQRAERYVSKMEGALTCLDLDLIRVETHLT